jgi:hypothetical protein
MIYLGESTVLSSAAFNRIFAPGSFSHDESRDLLSRPWFTRVWVFQEIVVSKRPWLYCGLDRLPWGRFSPMLSEKSFRANVSLVFDEKLSRHVATSLSIWHIDRARSAHQENSLAAPIGRSELLDLLFRRRGFEATDPRDVVYALTGLIQQTEESQMVVVDYTKSWEEVYNEAAATILAIEHRHAMLHFVDVSRYPVTESLASWAPDWRFNPQENTILAHSSIAGISDFAPYSDDLFNCDMYPESGIIACRGDRHCDVVRYASTTLDRKIMNTISVPAEFWIGNWSRTEEQTAKCYQYWKAAYSAWRNIIGDQILPPYEIAPEDFGKGPFGFPDSVTTSLDSSQVNVLQALAYRTTFKDEENRPLHGWKVALMASGTLGLVSGRTVERDVVCRFAGSSTLFTLHPLDPTASSEVDQKIRNHFSHRVADYGHFKFAGPCTLDTSSASSLSDMCYILH